MTMMTIRNAAGEILRTEDWPRSLPPPVLVEGETATRWRPADRIVIPPPAAKEPPPPVDRWSVVDKAGEVKRIILWDGVAKIELGDSLEARPWKEGDTQPPPDAADFNADAALERVAIEQLKRDYVDSFNRKNESAPELSASPPPSPAVVALEGMEALKAKIDAGRASVPADMVEALAGEDVSSPAAIQKLTERLNIEKAELRRERAAGDMPTEREKQVDRLLNWLAQFGEA